MERRVLLERLADRAVALELPHPARVAVDGVDAAGKTTLADELANVLSTRGREVVRASSDAFHHPQAIRRRRGALDPEGYYCDAFDHAAILERLLEPLGPGGTLRYRCASHDLATDERLEPEACTASRDAILVFDGVFLQRPELAGHFDLVIFVRAGFETTLARARERDLSFFGSVEEIERRYAERYVPAQRHYLAAVRPARRADLVVTNDDPEHPELRG